MTAHATHRNKPLQSDNALKPRVAVFNHTFLELSQTFIYEQLRGASAGFDVVVLCHRRENDKLFPWDQVFSLDASRWQRAWSRVARLIGYGEKMSKARHKLAWKAALKRHRVRLIHAHFGPAGIELLALAKQLRLPLLVTFHGYDASYCLKDPSYIADLRELFRYGYGLTVCDAIRSRLVACGLPEDRLKTHYIGVSLDKFDWVARTSIRDKVSRGEEVVLLQTGRFVEKKGHRYTVEAFRHLCGVYPNCRLHFVGDGPLLESSRQLVSELGLDASVVFHGALPSSRVAELLRDVDAFVHHSVTSSDGDQEGIPISLMEAMASGLPVVTSFHSGIPELVIDGETGYVVPERDIPAYQAALVRLLDCAGEIGKAGRTRVKQFFNLDIQNRLLRGIYSEFSGASSNARLTN